MTAHRPADRSPRFSRTRIALAALAAAITMAGCAAQTGFDDEADSDVAVSDAALIRGGGGSTRNGYTCSGGTCTCDKSIENDCEDMSGVCTDATVDALINCINGWLTTHCTCTQAFVRPPTPIYTLPINTAVLKSL
jgi:hypothetical protein